MLIDSHCHLQDPAFGKDIDAVIKNAVSSGVTKMVCVGTNLKDSSEAVELSDKFEGVYAAVGIYPHEAVPKEKDLREEVGKLSRSKKVVAIGECGLDYFHKGRPKEEQKILFRKQIGTAILLDLPLIIHNRGADTDTIEELSHYKNTGRLRGVLHCFTSDLDMAKRALDLNFYISFSSIITYEGSEGLREVARSLPRERILVETDSPLLPPVRNRRERNEPKNVKMVAEGLSEILGLTLEKTAVLTTKNAQELFKI